jgi:hypothetical protein
LENDANTQLTDKNIMRPLDVATRFKNKKVIAVMSELPDTPQSFGYKCQWLAVKNVNTELIINVLNLKEIEKRNWNAGIDEAHSINGIVFVSPPVDGWTFVIGPMELPGMESDKEPVDLIEWLTDISRELGEVHYYGSHRVVEYHAWAKAINGELIRAYGYLGESGEVLADIGELTDEEEFLDVEVPDEEYGFYSPNEETVMELAGLWSINPQTLDEYTEKGTGYIATMKLR